MSPLNLLPLHQDLFYYLVILRIYSHNELQWIWNTKRKTDKTKYKCTANKIKTKTEHSRCDYIVNKLILKTVSLFISI